jgi:hypothetical protein
MQEKSCHNCKHRFNKSCPVPEKLLMDSIEDKVQCKLEDGTLDEILREELDLTELFDHMQEEGYIKKSAKVKELAQNEDIINLMIEQINDKIWNHIIRKVSDVEIDIEFDNTSDFYCSEWR